MSAATGVRMVLAAKVREIAQERDLKVSGEFLQALNTRVEHLVRNAAELTKAAERVIIKADDLV